MVTNDNEIVLEARGIYKSFGYNQVLTGVDFSLKKGEIHGLLGLNGSGKTTLLNILNGVFEPDKGEIVLFGKKIEKLTPEIAKRLGLVLCNQIPMIFYNLTVSENILIGQEPVKKWAGGVTLIDKTRLRQISEEVLELCGFELSPDANAKSLTPSQQKQVEIARALTYNAQVIFFDEPTNMMSPRDAERLFELMLELKNKGKSIVYVTHRISEAFRICDRITVLRDGKRVGTVISKESNVADVVAMISRNIASVPEHKKKITSEEVIIELRNVTALPDKIGERMLEDINLKIFKGQITGIVGVVGSGKTELAKVIAGIKSINSGEVIVLGEPVSNNVLEMIKRGVFYLPEDIMVEGLIPAMSIRENMSLVGLELGEFAAKYPGGINRKEEKEMAVEIIRRLNIVPQNTEFPVQRLSGGNKKKVLIGRGLLVKPKILLLDEPTMGVDIPSSMDFLNMILKWAEEGITPIIFSSEFERILPILERVIILRDGKIVGELYGEEISETKINTLIAE
ncbi:MAG: ABC transporter related [Caldanaerobacter subterraneus]|uniref:sugar ABC transporter ATP-binding protein n=1 Tax=Caldanaerobacter subterraneus TaxID=911092 RepID=UPI00074B1F15|nr:sugar ABC transporter ATP-binding protein [Caldanaerobacter subterraneus]KUK08470.1 MAG: ABC transporter related [Caldanaerobacter subterraneus]